MEYRSIDDIKAKIESIMNTINNTSPYYDDFKWFSKVNYTTTTEYYGELRNFFDWDNKRQKSNAFSRRFRRNMYSDR